MYSPKPFGTEALTFRHFGPINRFDHHRLTPVGAPSDDPDRGILYAGVGLVCCLGEFFADSAEIATVGAMVATIRATRPIEILDLRRTAATGVGTTQAVAAIGQCKVSQAWARWWYQHPDLTTAQGLLYSASNSGHDAFALFERAEGSLAVEVDLALGAPALTAELELAADALHWPIGR